MRSFREAPHSTERCKGSHFFGNEQEYSVFISLRLTGANEIKEKPAQKLKTTADIKLLRELIQQDIGL